MFEVFIEGTKTQKPERQYVTFVDFPIPVMVAGRGIYLKRCRLIVDVTGRGLSGTAHQDDVEEWAAKPDICEDLQRSCAAYAIEVSQSDSAQQEAQAWMGATR